MNMVERTCARDGCDVVFPFSPSAQSGAARQRFCCKPCSRRQRYLDDVANGGPADKPVVARPLPWPEVLMTPQGEWARQAACAAEGVDPVWFEEPDDEVSTRDRLRYQYRAGLVCSNCPVRRECAADADSVRAVGVWGGVYRGPRGGRIDLLAAIAAGRYAISIRHASSQPPTRGTRAA